MTVLETASTTFEYEGYEIFIRVLAYGALSCTDIIILLILASYIWRWRHSWKYNSGIHLAVALGIFTFGQFIRSGSMWAQYFIAASPDLDADTFFTTIALTMSPFFVLAGAAMLTYNLAPDRWRWPIMIGGCLVAVIVPIISLFVAIY